MSVAIHDGGGGDNDSGGEQVEGEELGGGEKFEGVEHSFRVAEAAGVVHRNSSSPLSSFMS